MGRDRPRTGRGHEPGGFSLAADPARERGRRALRRVQRRAALQRAEGRQRRVPPTSSMRAPTRGSRCCATSSRRRALRIPDGRARRAMRRNAFERRSMLVVVGDLQRRHDVGHDLGAGVLPLAELDQRSEPSIETIAEHGFANCDDDEPPADGLPTLRPVRRDADVIGVTRTAVDRYPRRARPAVACSSTASRR